MLMLITNPQRGTHQETIHLSRVPVEGEIIKWNDQFLNVLKVVHLTDSAEVALVLVGRHLLARGEEWMK